MVVSAEKGGTGMLILIPSAVVVWRIEVLPGLLPIKKFGGRIQVKLKFADFTGFQENLYWHGN